MWWFDVSARPPEFQFIESDPEFRRMITKLWGNTPYIVQIAFRSAVNSRLKLSYKVHQATIPDSALFLYISLYLTDGQNDIDIHITTWRIIVSNTTVNKINCNKYTPT